MIIELNVIFNEIGLEIGVSEGFSTISHFYHNLETQTMRGLLEMEPYSRCSG